jgi:epoxyqueuosine reductase QueG
VDLYSAIKDAVSLAKCDYLGVADLTTVQNSIVDQGGSIVAGFPRAISIGIILPSPIVDQLPNRSNRAVAVNYRNHAYLVINQRLDVIASRISSIIQRAGHNALPVPTADRCDDERICAVFSHKMAANLAGLGWIGKSCLLVTPQAGPRVRWTTVLTDAPLSPTGKRIQERCGDCTECVKICPVHAFTGRPFDDQESRDTRYDARKCEQYLAKVEKETGLPVCGLCLYVCPHGRQQRESNQPSDRTR